MTAITGPRGVNQPRIISNRVSSTGIVVKLLVDTRATNEDYGQIAIGILLVQDLFVVVLLTLVSGLGGGNGGVDLSGIVMGLGQAFGGMVVLLLAVLALLFFLIQKEVSGRYLFPGIG